MVVGNKKFGVISRLLVGGGGGGGSGGISPENCFIFLPL